MHYFALHIKTGSEEKIRKAIEEELGDDLKVFCPMRELMIRKKGKTTRQLKPMFGGYIFVESEEISAASLTKLKKIPDFFQVLPSNKDIKPVRQEDMEFLRSLFTGNQIAALSKAKFDENDLIQIISGPLKGKEGMIVKVDRRKGRAKIVINAFDREHFVDLGFEVMGEV
ncbi:antiterminator LoaP [Spirochaeta isovalerica]|uniref:Transcriptional antiterminator NusG n=1 Tax=Spirochaeta isovalerica TaxID=150 RepID=A0A841RBM5_9SPIO|nr:antiterminator LoaP [Spirochaeta isovalerica]MBB6480761.1 transcriptional antiterminator NusG [Spirochaeta isovalerica]